MVNHHEKCVNCGSTKRTFHGLESDMHLGISESWQCDECDTFYDTPCAPYPTNDIPNLVLQLQVL